MKTMTVKEYVQKHHENPFHGKLKKEYEDFKARSKDHEESYGREYREPTRKEFLDWRLGTMYSFYLVKDVIECNSQDMCFDGRYADIKVYKNTESNIATYTLSIGGYSKTFLIENEYVEEYLRLSSLNMLSESDLTGYREQCKSHSKRFLWQVQGSKALSIDEYLKLSDRAADFTNYIGKSKAVMCPTKDDWYGTFPHGYVCVSMSLWNPDIDLYHLHMMGTDDCSHSLDVIGREKAKEIWTKALTTDNLTKQTFKEAYFSN